jgi:hypothetical protein
MIIQKRTMGWLPKVSAYNQIAAANAKRKAANQAFMSNQASMADAFGAIQTNFTIETGNIVSKIAAQRMGLRLR